MKMISVAATPVAFFVPSRSKHVTAGKLALIGMVFTTFFLFTAGYHFPGGAKHYPDWAEAIVRGTTLYPDAAQREVGLPLLYILGGFPFTHSFIGITLIFAAFAILIPVLVYLSVAWASPAIAFYTSVACIISLAPFTYLKFFYPDQAYMFFNLLATTLLIGFLWSGKFRLLYYFTLAALAASFTRTAGNLMYPVLLTIAYVTVRGNIRHYLGCVLIFVLATGAYQWHRYEIFDVRHQSTVPSGKGMQIFYGTYLNLGDFGVRLSPDFGPNTKIMLDKLRQELQPSARESALIKRALYDDPREFMEKHVYAYTPEELFEQICTKPNEEYWNILYAIEPADQFYLDVAKEIALSNPWYVVRYSARNLWHAVFDPGYGFARYNATGYARYEIDYMPATQGWGVRSEDPVTQYGKRAEREMEYFQLKDQSQIIQRIFDAVSWRWVKYFPLYLWATAALIIAAWIGVLVAGLCWAAPRSADCQALKHTGIDKLVAPVVAASALLLYEDLATAMFSQPNHRYFHMTEPLRFIIVGFGIAFLMALLSTSSPARITVGRLTLDQQTGKRIVSAIQEHDLLDGYFGRRPAQWISLLVALCGVLFVWWVYSLIIHT